MENKDMQEMAEKCKIYRNGEYYKFDYVRFGDYILEKLEEEEEEL